MTLCYDELTGQYFVGDPIRIKARLKILENKEEFSYNDYCDALDIPHEDPFGDYCFKLKSPIYKHMIFKQALVKEKEGVILKRTFVYRINEMAVVSFV